MSKRYPNSPMPAVTSRRFLILAGLLNGQELTRMELCSEIDWNPVIPNFVRQTNALHCAGYVEKVRVTVSGKVREEVRYRITAAGRRAWQECIDYYVFVAEQYGRGSGDATNGGGSRNGRVLHRAPIPPNRNPPKTDRWMTAEERKRLFAVCSNDCFRRLVVALQELKSLTVAEVGALDVGDFDLETSELVIRSKRAECRLPVSPELATVIVESIGERTSGPLFPASLGGRWTTDMAGRVFRTLRGPARIPVDVMLRGMSYRKKCGSSS